MLRNKNIVRILSLLIAVVLWAYVMGEINPETTIKFKNINVEILNQESLEDRGLALVGTRNYTVDIALEGKRSAVKKVKKEDIGVTADVTGYKKGTHYVEVKVSTPDNTKVSNIKESRIKVKIDRLVAVRKVVNVVLTEKGSSDLELGNISVTPEEIEVTGAESTVAKVKNINVAVTKAQIEDADGEEVRADAKPVDKNGNTVKGVTLSVNSVNVKAKLYHFKTVPLKLNIKGKVGGRYQVANMDVPNDITIRGSKTALSKIESIKADVDISRVTESTELPVNPKLPKGVQISNRSDDMKVKLTLKPLAIKSLEVDTKNVKFTHVGTGLEAEAYGGAIGVTISGSDKVVKNTKAANIEIVADLKGLAAGMHSVNIEATDQDDLSTVILSPKIITVTITEKRR